MQRKINEKWLVYRVRVRKEPEAYGKLYDLYIEKIYRFVYFKVGVKEEAEDLTSAIFLKVWNYLIEQTEKEIDSFSGLVYKVARNIIIDHYRNKATHRSTTLEEIENLPDNSRIIEKIESAQEVQQLEKLIKKLKQDYQEVLTLRFVDDLSISEIAEILGRSQISTRVMLHRALKKLKDLAEIKESRK